MVLTQPEDLDVIGLAEDDLEAAFQVFFVRGGRVLGRKGWVVDRVEDLEPGGAGGVVRPAALHGADGGPAAGPGAVACPTDREVLRGVARRAPRLQGRDRRARARREAQADGGREPQRRRGVPPAQAASGLGLRRALPGARGAGRAARPGRRRRCGSSATTSPTWGRPTRSAPWWSSRTGSQTERLPALRDQGRPRTGRLRQHGGDAPTAVRPADPERDEPAASTRRRFAYPPALVVVDGGKGQLGVCSKVLADVGLDIPHIGLAKRLEEVYFPGRPEPLMIPRAPRRCSSCSTSAMRRTGSRSPTTARSGRSGRWPRRSTTCPAWAPPGRRRCSAVRLAGAAAGRVGTRSRPRRGSGRSWRGRSTTGCTASPLRAAG